MYINEPLKTYLDDLAAKRPAPGGGSAAALSGAIGMGLISMSANFTVGNPKYKSVEAKAADLLVRSDGIRSRLQDLVDDDVDAYNKLSAVMKSGSATPSELEKGCKLAAQPPFDTCMACVEGLKLCADIVKWGNKSLMTDIAIAAILLEGGFFSAKFNVYLNLKYIKDLKYIEKIHKVLLPLEEKMPKLKVEILEKCEEIIER